MTLSLKDLNLKRSYSSEEDDLLNDFYLKVLSEAQTYRRIAGYFSSSIFSLISDGIFEIIKKGGRLKFISNVYLSKKDYDAINNGLKTKKECVDFLVEENFNKFLEINNKDNIRLLSWLISNNFLEIKIGVIDESAKGILHQKVGIMSDQFGNTISFSGSNNESFSGWVKNSEKFKVFFDWDLESNQYVEQDIMEFENLWNDSSKKTRVFDFSNAVKKKLIAIIAGEKIDFEKLIKKVEFEFKSNLSSKKIIPRDYQLQAIDNWFKNKKIGLFEMATGTGKTATAIFAIKKTLELENKLCVVISCPFVHLIPQWQKAVNAIGVEHIGLITSSSNIKWKIDMPRLGIDYNLGRIKCLIFYATHDTVSSQYFLDKISKIDGKKLFVGDEVHALGSNKRMSALFKGYDYRIGLSATPNRYFDKNGTKKIFDFFDKTIFEFDLKKAIECGFLAEYNYYVNEVKFTPSEFEEYISLSKKISKFVSQKDEKSKKILERLLTKRQDLLRNAFFKLNTFKELIYNLSKNSELYKTLVYCSPQQIKKVQEIISRNSNAIQHKFTSYENLDLREKLLEEFQDGIYDILVAIKCLDEGVDVPSTRTAIILSNTNNPKEWIQRRGRVLRVTNDKNFAIIYDFMVLPPDGFDKEYSNYSKKLIESQFERLTEMAEKSKNYDDGISKIYKLKLKYNNL
jgi:superfamily II DNA or RNA helicase